MKNTSQKLFFYTATTAALMTSGLVHAQTWATAPTLEGGISASIGALYLTPSSDNQDYAEAFTFSEDGFTETVQVVEVNPGYDFGWQAALGYVFEDTANGIELQYREINTSDDDSIDSTDDTIVTYPGNLTDLASASSTLKYELNAADLMFSQFLDLGTHVQMRFQLGASYVNLEQKQNSNYLAFIGDTSLNSNSSNEFSGFGPRLAADGRYEFGDGFGLLGGASIAYYLGDLDSKNTLTSTSSDQSKATTIEYDITDDVDNHGVTNLRANIGIDYVYFFDNEDRSTIGIELGYLVDYYADATQQLNVASGAGFQSKDSIRANYANSDTTSISFSGPYLEVKGVF